MVLLAAGLLLVNPPLFASGALCSNTVTITTITSIVNWGHTPNRARVDLFGKGIGIRPRQANSNYSYCSQRMGDRRH